MNLDGTLHKKRNRVEHFPVTNARLKTEKEQKSKVSQQSVKNISIQQRLYKVLSQILNATFHLMCQKSLSYSLFNMSNDFDHLKKNPKF